MISRIIGTILKKNTKTKSWWCKLAMAIILSNFMFFLLFSTPSHPQGHVSTVREGWVEAHFKGEIMTPFRPEKRVIILHRQKAILIEAYLHSDINTEGKYTVWVKEAEASILFQNTNWEILPYLKNLKAFSPRKGITHEISY